jgi:hypothetical protein
VGLRGRRFQLAEDLIEPGRVGHGRTASIALAAHVRQYLRGVGGHRGDEPIPFGLIHRPRLRRAANAVQARGSSVQQQDSVVSVQDRSASASRSGRSQYRPSRPGRVHVGQAHDPEVAAGARLRVVDAGDAEVCGELGPAGAR